MAEQELKVKFKVDTTDVKSGADEAKQKVKEASSEMASEVNAASQKMETSLEGVSKAAEGIGEASQSATDSVKGMESQVESSAKKMETSLEGVSKKMSSMQMFSMGSRGIGIVGGLAEGVATAFGADETASLIGTATNIGQSSMQGAAAGFAIAGPVGAAIGGLTGAAQSLLKAGNDLQAAAKAQDEKAKSDLESQRKDIIHQNNVTKWTEEARNLATAAYGDENVTGTEAGKAALNAEIAAQRGRIDDLTKRRNQIALNYDENGDVFAQAEQMRALNDAIAFATEKLNILTNAAQEAEQQDSRLQAAEAAEIKATEDAIAARKKEAEAARKKAEADEAAAKKKEQQEADRLAKAAQKAEIDEVKEQKREQERTIADTQRQLEGVISRPSQSPTDALTRMGGGRGYASYNNSTANVQVKIESHLKTLMNTQKAQLQEISNKLDALEKISAGASTWQPD